MKKQDVNNISFLKKQIIFSVLLIIFGSIISYHPLLDAKFTNWDDDRYVINNPDIRQISNESIKTFFSKSYEGNYHPLTMLSYALDYHTAQLEPRQYHLTNILFHIINSLLVFWLVLLFNYRWESALIAGLLFAIHTLHVESVAWVSERKDVLYACFYFLSLILYVIYIKKNSTLLYIGAVLFFMLSILSKGMAVALCFTLIATDIYLGRNLKSKKVILEKIPFIIIAVIMGIVALHVQQIKAVDITANVFSFSQRIVIGGYGFIEYILKLIFPVNLSHFYPYPSSDGNLPAKFYFYFFIFLAFTFYLIYSFFKKKISKDIMYCYLFFLLNIFLVLQIIPVGEAIMADRYSYIASVGVFLFAGYVYESFFKTKHFKIIYFIGIMLYAVLLISFTRERCKVWDNSISLWDDMIKKYPVVAMAYDNRGLAKADAKKYDDAIADYNKAIVINKKYCKSYNNMGVAKILSGKHQEAINDFTKAIEIDTGFIAAYQNRAKARQDINDYNNALADYTKLLSLNVKSPEVYGGIGWAKYFLKEYNSSIEYYNKAVSLDPSDPHYLSNRGLSKSELKDYEGAMSDYQKAIASDNKFHTAYFNIGVLKFNTGKKSDACEYFFKAKELGNKDAENIIEKYCK